MEKAENIDEDTGVVEIWQCKGDDVVGEDNGEVDVPCVL